jgi:hypothetical protein
MLTYRHAVHAVSVLAGTALLAACASVIDADPAPSARKETVIAVLGDGQVVKFNAGDPGWPTHRAALKGLEAGETLVGIDYRVARGLPYALSSRGRLFTLDVQSGQLSRVGNTAVALQGPHFGVDFNPAVDRIRVVSDSGQNLRLHPDTGALVSADPALNGAEAGAVQVTAAGYTYNKKDDKLTTNFAIDAQRGWLVRQGTAEGVQPPVSPNTGRIFPVGPLGTGPADDASFDIADTDNTALAALSNKGRTRLYRVDLGSGAAQLLGTISSKVPVWGIAIQP